MPWYTNKTAIVTGSTRGIGLETARVLLGGGGNVVIFCRHKGHGKEAAQKLKASAEGGSAFGGKSSKLKVTYGDVRKIDDIKRIIQEAADAFGGVDILINNAGVAVFKDIEETSDQEYDEVLDTNLKGAFLFTREVLPMMKKQNRGRILNISSGLGLQAKAKYSVYCSSKFGLIGLTQVTADEVKDTNIVCVAIAPGGVATKLHLEVHPWEDPSTMMQPDYIGETIVKKTLLERPPRNGSTIEIYS
ncbi:SDR family oxidoreductase [Patescibacteria group bacterium]|nr:SDR family oxidoreductase [Patescibacteria group bacterium]